MRAPVSELNTTPLIDVMLVLLVMLITTLPLMTHSTQLVLGRGAKTPPLPPAVLAIERDGSLIADGHALASVGELDRWLTNLAREGGERGLQIRPDRHVNYGAVAQALAAAQRNAVAKLSVAPIAD